MTPRRDALLWCLLAYAAASLFHYSHNAEFLASYPNLPAWITRSEVYLSWLGMTAIGAAGYALFARGYQSAGRWVLTMYGLMGLGGLGHYAVAPMSAHTLAMNASIWLEASTAIGVLAAVVLQASRTNRRAKSDLIR